MDFDPRWIDDSRYRDDGGWELSQGSRGGTSDSREHPSRDPREVFTRDLDLPRGPTRERVRVRDQHVTLRGSESRTLATVGAFRVVPAEDLRDGRGRALDPRDGDLEHLKRERLVETIPVRDGRALVVLTEKGRDVLESHRRDRARSPDDAVSGRERSEPRQEFHAGRQRPRELLHDAQVYRAYEREAKQLRENDALILRVQLDTELKREYQEFLQENNRGRSDSDGRPDRSPDEIARWAMDHNLPEKDGHVQFPDARIVYEGREHTLDIEVETLHYRGGHAAAKASSGFSRHSGSSMRVVGARGRGGAGGRRGAGGRGASIQGTGRSGGRPFDPRVAEELLR